MTANDLAHNDMKVLFAHGGHPESSATAELLMGRYAMLLMAADETEARSMFLEQSPDLVVIAHNPPRLDGYALASSLRMESMQARMVMLCNTADADSLSRLLDLGASGVVYYPVDAGCLCNLLDRCSRELRQWHDECGRTRQNDLLARAVADAPCGVILADSAEVLSYVNNFALNMMGGNRADIVGSSISNVLHRYLCRDGVRTGDDLLAAASRGMSWKGVLRIRRGNSQQALVTETRRVHDGSSYTTMIVMHKPGEYERSAAMLRETGNALNGLLDLQLQSLPHLQELQDDLEILENSGLTQQQAALVKTARDHTMATSCLLMDIRSLGGLGRGNYESPEGIFFLRDLMETIRNDMLKMPGNQARTVSTDVPPYLPEQFLGDQLLLAYALKSLFSSTLNRGGSGEVTVGVDLKERNGASLLLQFFVQAACPEVGRNHYESADEYIGWLEQERRTTELPGVCLAVHLSRYLKGSVWVKSEAGRSLTYYLTLRLTERSFAVAKGEGINVVDDAAPPVASSAAVLSRRIRRVLLAEDNVVDQTRIRRLLEKAEFEVVTAGNGREAVEEFEQGTFDIVLMDILMPEMDGFEATRLIRERERLIGTRIPIIALTAYSLKAVHEKCLRIGMDGYISKPVTLKDMFAVFKRVLGSADTQPQACELLPGDESELSVLDQGEAVNNLDGDRELYREILDLFCVHAPPVFEELMETLRMKEKESVERAAHRLKGMSSNIGALRFSRKMRIIQDEARCGTLAAPGSWVEELPGEFQALLEAIEASNA